MLSFVKCAIDHTKIVWFNQIQKIYFLSIYSPNFFPYFYSAWTVNWSKRHFWCSRKFQFFELSIHQKTLKSQRCEFILFYIVTLHTLLYICSYKRSLELQKRFTDHKRLMGIKFYTFGNVHNIFYLHFKEKSVLLLIFDYYTTWHLEPLNRNHFFKSNLFCVKVFQNHTNPTWLQRLRF